MTIVQEIRDLFERGGAEAYFGEEVTQLQHALQTAHLAMEARADDEMVVAALLHDIGHLLGGEMHAEIGVIDHDRSCLAWLEERRFSERAVALISGHVSAKRYLVAAHPEYREKLSVASTQTLELQGGAMSAAEAEAFEASPYFRDMLRLRSWDEQAKDPHAVVPALGEYESRINSAVGGRGEGR